MNSTRAVLDPVELGVGGWEEESLSLLPISLSGGSIGGPVTVVAISSTDDPPIDAAVGSAGNSDLALTDREMLEDVRLP